MSINAKSILNIVIFLDNFYFLNINFIFLSTIPSTGCSVITHKWCGLAEVYGQMYLKLVPLSSFGPVHKYWSRSDKRDKFCKRNINFYPRIFARIETRTQRVVQSCVAMTNRGNRSFRVSSTLYY